MVKVTKNAAGYAGFTLVELLVVITIIGVLGAISVPVIGRVRSSAKTSVCLSNLRELTRSTSLYINENKGRFPPAYKNSGDYHWTYYLAGSFLDMRSKKQGIYINLDQLICPEQSDDLMRETSSEWYVNPHYGCNYRLAEMNVTVNSVQSPGRTFFYADTWKLAGAGSPDESRGYNRWLGGSSSVGSGWGVVAPRHNSNTVVNVSYVDGHVESIKIPTGVNPYNVKPFELDTYNPVYTGR